ncbi:MAG TPA: hypothetical protein VN132_08525, partial [Bdellovibrio sp.]|nr:hypothetical protein [Bdellovibrio sp.]
AKSSLNKDQKSKLTDSFNAAVFKVLLYDQNEWKLKDSFKKDWRLSGRAGENVFNYPDFHLSSDFLKKNPKDLEKLLIVDSMEPSKGTSFTTLLNELQAVFEEPRKYCWEQAQAYTCTALGITDHCTWYQDETHGNPREFKLGQLPGSNTKKENYFKNLSLKYPKVSPEIFQNMSDAMMKFCARATMVEIYDKDLLQTTARISKVDEPIMANSPILEQRVRAAGEKLRDESSSQKNSCSYNAITHVQCKDFDIPSFEKNSSFYQPSEVPSKYSEPQKSDKQKRKKARGIS